VLVFLPPVACI